MGNPRMVEVPLDSTWREFMAEGSWVAGPVDVYKNIEYKQNRYWRRKKF
jgi:hypothetical protein